MIRISAWIVSLALLGSPTAWSQSPSNPAPGGDTMPPWTVLVLKLVSATHVEPTTGIVLGAPDLVLVPLEFARSGDEILVLDGGTDIVRNGRPAFIVHSLPGDQLAVLRVQGLNRPAASLSTTPESEINVLKLVAFPPAEQIAQGAAPVRAQVKALPAITTAHPTLDPYPNVTGALSDDCGNLVAYNLAVDVQSMQAASGTRVAWPDGLKRAAELAGSPLREQSCQSDRSTASVAEEEDTQSEEPASPESPTEPEDPQTEADSSEPLTEDQPETAAEEDPQISADEELEGVGDPVDETDVASPDDAEQDQEAEVEVSPLPDQPLPDQEFIQGPNEAPNAQSSPARGLSRTTLFLAGLALLLILGWSIHKLRKKAVKSRSVAKGNSMSGKPTAEPRTVRFDSPNDASNSVFLLVEGHMSDGSPINKRLPVTGPDWQAEIGRQDTQVNIDSPAVSRLHCRIQVHEGRLTFTDLDSTNGSRVNGIACLPGEVFFIQTDDQILLGDVNISLALVASDDE